MKSYDSPTLEIIFVANDVITASVGTESPVVDLEMFDW